MKRIIFLGLIMVSLPGFAQESVVVRDLETWSAIGVKKKLNDDWEFAASQQFRFRENSSSLNNTFTELNLDYSPIKRLSIGLGYRYILDRDPDDFDITHLRRWNLDFGYSYKLNRIRVKSRLRFQNKLETSKYRDENDFAVNTIRLKLGIDYNIKGSKLKPYFDTEIFKQHQKLEDNRLSKFRVTAGTSLKMKGLGRLKCFYRFEKELGITYPQSVYIIGVNYFFKLK